MYVTWRITATVRPCSVWPALPSRKAALLNRIHPISIPAAGRGFFTSPKDYLIASKRILSAHRGSKIMASGQKEMCVPPTGYRANVGICLVNDENKVFVAERLDKPGAWQLPQGGVDEGENPQDAAFRELREETGVTSAELIAEVPRWICYDFPADVKADLNKRWGTLWNGQAQKWFLFRLTGNEGEIDIKGDGTEPPEFSQWRWASVEDVINEAVSFKRPVYEEMFHEFVPVLNKTATPAA